ncbi:MAG TPA: SMC-Scp complex subunit ScpB [Candidatus Paceibacterota bacterium]
MNELSLSSRIEALLFARSEPLSRDELEKFLKVDGEGLNAALAELSTALQSRGIALLDDGREVELRTSPLAASLLETMRKEELSRDIGKAGLETLAILLYKGPSTRSEIDFIRGVNSSHIVRILTMRGLARRRDNPKDERSYLYEPTTDLLGELGVAQPSDLPDFGTITEEVQTLLRVREESQKEEADKHADS